MNFHISRSIAGILGIVLLVSCGDNKNPKIHGAIVLGDSSTIVTEKDPRYLQDMVTDFAPAPVAIEEPATAAPATPVADTARTEAPAVQPAAAKPVANGKGTGLDLDGINIFIPNIESRTFGKANKNSASVQLTTGNLAGNQLKITGGTVQKVTQRYQTVVVLHHDKGDIKIDALTYSSEWMPLKGSGSNYYITGIEPKKLKYENASQSVARTAVTKEIKSKRFNKKKENDYLGSVSNIRSVTQDPLEVRLNNVVWRIDGKDSKGKSFHKEVRVDL